MFISKSAAYGAELRGLIRIDVDSPTVEQVLRAVEQQTEYKFFYDSALNTSEKTTLSAGDVELNKIFDHYFKKLNIDVKVGTSLIALKYGVAVKGGQVESSVSKKKPVIATALLRGRVVDEKTNQPIEGAIVALSGALFNDAVSDEKGEFVVANLLVGNYDITILHDHYRLKSIKEQKINKGSNTLQPIYLGAKVTPTVGVLAESVEQSDALWMDEAVDYFAPKSKEIDSPKFALKTNILQWATTSLNLAFEVRLSDKVTLELPVCYNPWEFSDNKQFKHILIQPEVRYWTRESFNGHFVGANIGYSFYNIGNLSAPFGLFKSLKEHRYEGSLYGAGISYGYQWMLSNRLSLEATAGVGYFYADYDKYPCAVCGKKIESGTKHYVGLTKLGISLSYYFR